MDMVRQHHDGVDCERVAPSRVPERRPQQFDMSVSSRNRRSVRFTVKK
jgi:hypothetical protein